jgi:hypothetical protein
VSDATITLQSAIECAVCRRTLLRGEHADVFRQRGARRLVCELCTLAALARLWVPEGDQAAEASPLRRRILRRFLRRRSGPAARMV